MSKKKQKRRGCINFAKGSFVCQMSIFDAPQADLDAIDQAWKERAALSKSRRG